MEVNDPWGMARLDPQNRFSKAALMNIHNMFYGEIEILMPLYHPMPSLPVSY